MGQASSAVSVQCYSEATGIVDMCFKVVLVLPQALEWSPPKML